MEKKSSSYPEIKTSKRELYDLGIDLDEAINRKINKNHNKYPLEKSKGNNKKYNEL